MTPDEHTNKEFFLDVGDGHQLYVQDWGNPKAKTPILVFHGGPGNGCDDRDKRGFDLSTQRVIFHDQRGAGKSIPKGTLDRNTTPNLVEDIEKIASHLKVDKFIVIGGSWGATLALAYGITYPHRVAAMIINGVFTATPPEIDWLDNGGWRDFFPDVWQQYLDNTPASHRSHPTAYHLKAALSDDEETAKKSTYAYETMELALLKLDDRYEPSNYEAYDPSVMRIEMHYGANNFFLPQNHILEHAVKLTMPIYLIVGRYDMVCPPAAAYKLHAALPNSKLAWTINGHLRQHEASNVQKLFLDQALGEA